MKKVFLRGVLVALLIGILTWTCTVSEVHGDYKGAVIDSYVYDLVVMGEPYTIVIETDGIVSGLNYNNYSFSINWETFGTFENITIPKALNETSIKVTYCSMVQGWIETPQLTANSTHYFIIGPDPEGFGHIDKVFFGLPNIEMDLSAPTTALGYYVNITGVTTYRGKPVNDVGVRITWSSSLGGVSNEISTVVPSSDGSFNVGWMPHATGTFYIIAQVFPVLPPRLPDEVPVPEAYACLSVSLPYEEHVFTVISNSTITSLVFNSTSHILSFSASGPDGTIGYAKVLISKQLLADIYDLKVYVDGNPKNYTFTSSNDSWIVKIYYMHSTHQIQIVIPEYATLKMLLPFAVMTLAAAISIKKKRISK